MAIESGLFDLYEIEKGAFKLTGPSEKLLGKKRKPVGDYFKTQSRFKALTEDKIAEIQAQIDAKWAEYEKLVEQRPDEN